jgi:hypothetical protein
MVVGVSKPARRASSASWSGKVICTVVMGFAPAPYAACALVLLIAVSSMSSSMRCLQRDSVPMRAICMKGVSRGARPVQPGDGFKSTAELNLQSTLTRMA